MSEELEKTSEGQQEQAQAQEQEQEATPDLAKVLAQLSEGLARLEAKLTPQQQQQQQAGVPTPEELLAELEKEGLGSGGGTTQQAAQPQQIDWDALAEDPKALATTILAQIEAAYFRPLLQRIEYLRVRDEIKECRSKYPDFDSYKDHIFALGMRNPYLTLEEAYHIAKASKPQQQQQQQPQQQQQAQQPTTAPKGEKRGITQRATEHVPKSTREAALKAMQEVLGT